jgi:hypothetical protein
LYLPPDLRGILKPDASGAGLTALFFPTNEILGVLTQVTCRNRVVGDLALVVLVLVKKASDPSSQDRRIQDLANGAGIVEELSLELGGDRTPLQNQRGSQAPKDMFLFLGQVRTLPVRAFLDRTCPAGLAVLGCMHRLVVIVGEPLLIIRAW